MSSFFQNQQPDFKENELHVFPPTDEKDMVVMSYVLKGELHQMQRSREEEMFKSMQRLARTCASKLEKKTKAKKSKTNAIPHSALEDHISLQQRQVAEVAIEFNGEEMNLEGLTNMDFQNDMIIRSPHVTFKVLLNPPTVLQFTTYPKTNFTVGCPIVPTVELANAIDYTCLWYQEKEGSTTTEYEFLSNEKVFTPPMTSINKKLKVYCTPFLYDEGTQSQITGRTTVCYFTTPIQAQPKTILSQLNECRQDFHSSSTSETTSSLRILTYNVLSEGYCLQERSVDILYGYVQREYLETEFRMQRILLELLAAKADIIALQECDKKVFDLYFLPYLGSQGYVGHYTNKISQVVEGCAIFIHTKSLRVIEYIDVPVKKTLRTASYLQPLYAVRPDLQDIIGGKLGTIGQIAIVQHKQHEEEVFLIANTHLFYHPLASYIRLLQCHVLLQRMERIRKEIQEHGLQSKRSFFDATVDEAIDQYQIQAEEAKVTALLSQLSLQKPQETRIPTSSTSTEEAYNVGVIILGDLNTTSDSPVFEYLTSGKVTAKWIGYAWERLSYFFWGDCAAETAEASEDIEKTLDANDLLPDASARLKSNVGPLSEHLFTHPFPLLNTTPSVEFTNYVKAFQNVLDYIFICDDQFVVDRVAPMPTLAELQAETATPSSVFPSDHLSLCIDVTLKKQQKNTESV